MVQSFLVPSYTITCYNKVLPPASATVKRWTSRSSSGDLPEANTLSSEAALLLALNESRVDATVLAESKTPAGTYQITRPRWYSKTEVAIILLLVQRWVRVRCHIFIGENPYRLLPRPHQYAVNNRCVTPSNECTGPLNSHVHTTSCATVGLGLQDAWLPYSKRSLN